MNSDMNRIATNLIGAGLAYKLLRPFLDRVFCPYFDPEWRLWWLWAKWERAIAPPRAQERALGGGLSDGASRRRE